MRLGDRNSNNFIDRTGQRGGGRGMGGMSSGIFLLLARFVFNKFGIVGIFVGARALAMEGLAEGRTTC